MFLPPTVKRTFDVLIVTVLGVLVLFLALAAFGLGALIYFLVYVHGV